MSFMFNWEQSLCDEICSEPTDGVKVHVQCIFLIASRDGRQAVSFDDAQDGAIKAPTELRWGTGTQGCD